MAFRKLMAACVAMTATFTAHAATADEVSLPQTIVVTTYPTGTGNYAQLVAIGGMLKNRFGVNLRALPAKNDVSRITPLKNGDAQFSAVSGDSINSQEGVFTFGKEGWGPLPVRRLLLSRANACVTLAIAGDLGVKSMEDLRGKRIAMVRGAGAIAKGIEAQLAFAGLTLNDMQVVEVGGYTAAINGLINDEVDIAITASDGTMTMKMLAGPRGVTHVPLPFSNEKGWAAMQNIVPWYLPGICTDGPAIPNGRMEGIASPYPILISTTDVDEATAYSLTKAMVEGFDDYKDAAPGAEGWGIDRQVDDFMIPYHEGTVKYLKEIGRWTEKAEANQQKTLDRQAILKNAWDDYNAKPEADFDKGWMAARAAALSSAGIPVIFESW